MPKSNFQRVYPKAGRITLDGGKNDKSDRSLILDEESPDCLNVIYDDARVQTRGGSSKLNTASVGSLPCDGLYTRHDSAGPESMVAWFGGTLYALSGTSLSTVGSAQSIFTAGERVYAAEYENYMFFGNGTNIPIKYADEESTRHGVYPPTDTLGVASGGTGTALSGTYSYKVTYVNSGLVESDAGPVSADISVISSNVVLTSIPVAPQSFGIESRRIYRTKAAGSTYFRIDTIADNATTTYDDGIDDLLLVTEEPADNGVPPNYSAVIYHLGRLFVIDPATLLVKYSEIANPYVFKVLSFRRIGDTTGDTPTSLAVYNGSIVVGCKRSTWIIYTPDADDANWTDIKVITPYGTMSGFSPFLYNNRLMFAASLNGDFVGFAALLGTSADPSVSVMTRSKLGSDMKSNVIENEMFNVPDAYQSEITAISYMNRAYITGPYGSGQTTNNRIWYYDYSYENLNRKTEFAWAPWTGINARDFTVFEGTLYCGTSDSTGFIYAMNQSSYNDDSVAIDSYVWTKELFGFSDDENWTKDFRWLNLYYLLTGAGDLKISVRIDSSGADPVELDDVSLLGAFLWDTGQWDRVEWDQSDVSTEKKISLGSFRGKRIQFKFSNGNVANVNFKIIGSRLTYNLKGYR